MFLESDFQLSMEKELRLVTMKSEIDKCDDLKVLRNSLMETITSLMKHQQLLSIVLARQIQDDIAKIKEATKKLDET